VGFLLSRRWVLFAVVVALMAWGAVQLGQWQFHRLEDRKHSNGVVATNLAAAPVPVSDVLSTRTGPAPDDEWKRVTAHGTWDDAHTLVLKYQTREGEAGVDVVTPLVTGDGTAVLVDRGWMSTENSGASRPDLPPAATGPVTVTGYVRRDATGSATRVTDLATRAVSSRTAAAAVSHPLYRGFLDLATQSPAASSDLLGVELPDDTSNGPHFFYGLQWWFFGALAVFGFCYLVYDEFRRRRQTGEGTGTPARSGGTATGPAGPRPRRGDVLVSEGAEHAAVDRQHHP
jgi:cytochrome oxidase assembly protein ShyY1